MIYKHKSPRTETLPLPTRSILSEILTADQLAGAIALAAQSTNCVIGEHVAAPRWPIQPLHLESVEAAIDFLVPPLDLPQFAHALDHHLMGLCPAYATHRYGGSLQLPLIQSVPAGTVHQWRHIWKKSHRTSLGWSCSRDILDGVLHQSQIGWRELDA